MRLNRTSLYYSLYHFSKTRFWTFKLQKRIQNLNSNLPKKIDNFFLILNKNESTGLTISSGTLYFLDWELAYERREIYFSQKWKIHSKASKWHQLGTVSNIGIRWHLSHQKKNSNCREWNCSFKMSTKWFFWQNMWIF